MKVLLVHTKRKRSASERLAKGLAYDVDDEARRSNERCVVYRMSLHPGVHPLRHKALRIRSDHAVLLRYQKPSWAVFPERTIHRHCYACGRNRPLNRGEQRQFINGGILREC